MSEVTAITASEAVIAHYDRVRRGAVIFRLVALTLLSASSAACFTVLAAVMIYLSTHAQPWRHGFWNDVLGVVVLLIKFIPGLIAIPLSLIVLGNAILYFCKIGFGRSVRLELFRSGFRFSAFGGANLIPWNQVAGLEIRRAPRRIHIRLREDETTPPFLRSSRFRRILLGPPFRMIPDIFSETPDLIVPRMRQLRAAACPGLAAELPYPSTSITAALWIVFVPNIVMIILIALIGLAHRYR